MSLEARLAHVFSQTDAAGSKKAYDDWAETYDQDMLGAEAEYVAPQIACEQLVRRLGDARIPTATVLDAGCGTGLVGVQLSRAGIKDIEGIDISRNMLRVAAKTGVYGTLGVVDMSGRLSGATDTYDAAICVGTMTQGHVGPEAFAELVRVVKPGGYVVSTVRQTIWESNGYKNTVEGLCEEKKAKLLSADAEEVSRGQGPQIILVVLEIL